MTANEGAIGSRFHMDRAGLATLFRALQQSGHKLVGPTVRDGAIVHAELPGIEALPAGWTDVQEPGAYRLVRRQDDALFGYNVGPHSWKPFFLMADLRLWQAERRDGTITVTPEPTSPPKLALIGARACDLQAIAVQDKVLMGGAHVDADYRSRRLETFVVALNCGKAVDTCFCTSMGTGPRAREGFDLALTELIDDTGHRFVVEIGSDRGAAMLATVPTAPLPETEAQAADAQCERVAASITRRMPASEVKDLLYRHLEHPRWDEVAERCLACGNCTMVCPTCFCTTFEEVTDLTGDHAERWRHWDSCFNQSFSYLHGGSVRPTIKSRYRQWMTHKLATWFDQFGTSGCVGCGRCLTWCPVGIDITEEVSAIQASEKAAKD
jgi:formate hydrogenlyase subunit 6/NADH:ubiquinone oxidoreductase subunit I